MYTVYILYSDKFSRTYTGFTSNIERRIKEHNSGKNKSTKGYLPWKLIFEEKIETRIEARKKEKYLKSGVGRDFIKTLLLSQK